LGGWNEVCCKADTPREGIVLVGDTVPAAGTGKAVTALVAVGGTAPESGAADREQAESDLNWGEGYHCLSFEPLLDLISKMSIALMAKKLLPRPGQESPIRVVVRIRHPQPEIYGSTGMQFSISNCYLKIILCAARRVFHPCVRQAKCSWQPGRQWRPPPPARAGEWRPPHRW
jgi:hypothetical protein